MIVVKEPKRKSGTCKSCGVVVEAGTKYGTLALKEGLCCNCQGPASTCRHRQRCDFGRVCRWTLEDAKWLRTLVMCPEHAEEREERLTALRDALLVAPTLGAVIS